MATGSPLQGYPFNPSPHRDNARETINQDQEQQEEEEEEGEEEEQPFENENENESKALIFQAAAPTNDRSEQSEHRAKRPRIGEHRSHEDTVISLFSSDEEGASPGIRSSQPAQSVQSTQSARTRYTEEEEAGYTEYAGRPGYIGDTGHPGYAGSSNQPQGQVQQGQVQQHHSQQQWDRDALLDIYASGAVLPPPLGQTAEGCPGTTVPSLTVAGHEYREISGGVGSSDTRPSIEPNEPAWATASQPLPTMPSSFPTTSGSSSQPTSKPEGGPDQRSPQGHIPVTEPQLCPEQAELVDIILSGRNVFYTGSAGCGKSTVLKAFTRRLRDRGLRVDIVAPTGISALGVGGSTTFVYAGWSLSSFRQPLEEVRRGAHRKYVRNRIKETDVLVIDEISMVENFHFERLNAVMQGARNSYKPFGGVQVIVTGDFHQLPPVKPFEYCLQCGEELVPNRSEAYVSCAKHGIFHDEDKWAFKSETWGLCNFVYFHLTTIHRQSDEVFIKILQKCRIGQPLTGEDTDVLMNHPSRTGSATKLYARREEVRRENQKRFDKLLSEKFSFPCLDDFRHNPDHVHFDRHNRRFPDGSLESLKDHRFEALVEFKKGMLVVLLVNLDLSRKLCNGSQGIVCDYEQFDPKKLPKVATKTDPTPDHAIHGDYAEFREKNLQAFMKRSEIAKKVWPIVRFHNGEIRTIYADCSVHALGNKMPYSLLSRTQIPLAPAWAMSIHKSQSLTLDRVIVDLTRAWEEGQVYVALSRATSLNGLKIEGDPKGLTVGKGGNSEVRKFHLEKFGI